MMMLCAAIGGPFATIAYVVALNSTTAASNPGVIVPIAALNCAIGTVLGRILFKQRLEAHIIAGVLVCLVAADIIGGTSFANMGPEALLGCPFAFLAVFGWGFEGRVAGFGTVLIGWFFSTDTQVSDGINNADGTTTYHVTTTLTNHLTADEADNSASYITGYNLDRRDNTDMVMLIYLVAPAGGSISNVSQEGGDVALQDFTELPYNGLSVTFANPRIDGGETMTVTYAVTCAAGAAPMTVRTTPTAHGVADWE